MSSKRKYGKKNEIKIDPLAYNICLLGEPKIGKEQPVSEPVLTENGWTPMGDIKVGTRVYGQDGKLYNVTDVFPQGIKDVYEVTFSDGTKTRCGLEHLWHVNTKKQRENMRTNGDYRFMIKSLKEIMEDYKVRRNTNDYEKYSYKYSVPINSEIEFMKTEDLPLDSYALGLLLGDGGFTGNTVTFTNPEDEIFKQLERLMDSLDIELHYREFENHKQATLCSSNENKQNRLTDILRSMNLFGLDSRQKFIPKQYIYSSIEDRVKLLSGIINTDGSVYEDVSISVSTYSHQMANDIAEVARSLGYIAIIYPYDRTNENSTNKYDKEMEYTVKIIGDCSKLHLSTKHENKLMDREFDYCKSIRNIELVGKEESQCIMVDNPQHLYITNDYIVTHNTTIIKEMLEKLVGEDGYMFLELAGEAGADAIHGIISEDCDEWSDIEDIIDDIEENRATDYKDLKALVFDTYDGWIKLAEEEAIRLWNKKQRGNPDKQSDTIDGAWGGFQKGEKYAFDLIFDIHTKLRKMQIVPIVIGHVKNRNIADVASGTKYQALTSDVDTVYFNLLKKKMHFIGLAYFDRTIITEKTGEKNIVTKKDITRNKVTSETRKIKFRDDNMALDSGSRFADIVEEIDFDVDSLITALTDAIKAEHAKSGKPVEETKKRQDKEKSEEFKEITKKLEEKSKQEKDKKKLVPIIEEISVYIKENKADISKIKPLIEFAKENGYKNPLEVDSLEVAKDLLAMIA